MSRLDYQRAASRERIAGQPITSTGSDCSDSAPSSRQAAYLGRLTRGRVSDLDLCCGRHVSQLIAGFVGQSGEGRAKEH